MSTTVADDAGSGAAFLGACAPERAWWLPIPDGRLRVHEWGDERAAPIVLCHGMWDSARNFDLLAPLLAQRYRVVAFDARGHGDSSWADAYIFEREVEDVVRVVQAIGRPVHLIGHSKGGPDVINAAIAIPEQVLKVVSIEGFGAPSKGFPIAGLDRTGKRVAKAMREVLDQARLAAERSDWRPVASVADLAAGRRAMNSRLSHEWLLYVCALLARKAADGWRWKVDPYAARRAFPWEPQWIAPRWAQLTRPLLAVSGTELEFLGPLPDDEVTQRLSQIKHVTRAKLAGAGHFPQIEKPVETASLLLDYLGQP